MTHTHNSEYFIVGQERTKCTLEGATLTLQNSRKQTTIKLDFSTIMRTHQDQYRNPIALSLQNYIQVVLKHDNPTILAQWEELLSQHTHKTNFHQEYYIHSKAGKGSNATVLTASHKQTQRKMAIKTFNRSKIQQSQTELLSLQNQIEILKELEGGYFPLFASTYITNHNYYLAYQWCEGLNLQTYAHLHSPSLQEIKNIAQQLAKALLQLQEHSIAHRDIKPQNIIYNPKSKNIKIIDLGFATHCQQQTHLFPNCGTPGYAAPELLDKRNTSISPQVDIFSLGVTLYYLLFGKLPYQKHQNVLLANKQCCFAFDPTLSTHPALNDLIRKTICPLKYRLSLEQLLSHPYFTDENQNSFIKTDPFSKLSPLDDDLDLLNLKIQQKRKQRSYLNRQRVNSLRTYSRSQIKKSLSKLKEKSKLISFLY